MAGKRTGRKAAKGNARRKSARKVVKKPRSISRTRKPEEMSLEDWQVALRRQIAVDLDLKLKNVGAEPVFSEYEVTNPVSKGKYRTAIRGERLGDNFCSCPDFAVNTLGTCKHIEFVLNRLRRRRGGEAALAAGYTPTYSEVYLRYGARREVVFRAGSTCPPGIRRSAARYFDGNGVMKPSAFGRFHRFLEKVTSDGQDHEVRCYDDALAFVSRVRDREALVQRINMAFPKGAEASAFDGLLKAELYPYQREGALFAARTGRCLMADDMGLGKTVQAIAAAEILARHADLRKVLVICPTSLKHQWQREIERFSGRSARVIEGLKPARARGYEAQAFYKIVNYDVVHRDLEEIRKVEPDLVILDEAQRIKNWKTRAAQSVKRIESDHAIVLTGTPLENRLEELHSIVEFVDRYRLGPMFRFLHTHQHVDDGGRVVGYHRLDEVSRTLAPILLRRTKAKVLKELPERIEKRFFLEMTSQQKVLHEENREIVSKIVYKWRRYGYLSEIDQRRLMVALQYMRMVCDSTYLLDQKTEHGPKADEVVSYLGDVLEDPAAKVVVFSQWLRMHELIQQRIEAHGWGHVLFHGGVPGSKRKALVARFREDPECRVFLSTDAGGVGLNLQAANVVANVDLPWNPAVLEQRIGRVHRLGQHRPVRVANFIAQDTIEERMLDVLAFKRSVFAGVLDGGSKEVFLGGSRLKKFMETVEKVSTGGPQGATGQTDGGDVPAGEAPGQQEARAEESTKAEREKVSAERGREVPPEDGVATQELGDLLKAGAAFLSQLGASLQGSARAGSGGTTEAGPGTHKDSSGLLEQDKESGQTFLRLPMPEGESLKTLTELLRRLSGQG